MPDAEIAVGKIRRRAARIGFIRSRGQGLSDRLRDERFLGREVPIKGATRQAGFEGFETSIDGL